MNALVQPACLPTRVCLLSGHDRGTEPHAADAAPAERCRAQELGDGGAPVRADRFVGIPSLIGPLVVWLAKRDSDAYVAAHSVHALNFNISVLIYTVVGGFALGIVVVVTLGIGLLFALPVVIVAVIVWLVLVIQGGLAASRGEQFRYPMTIAFVK